MSAPESIRIEPFDPQTATRDEWSAYHAYRRARHAERAQFDEPISPDDVVEARMKLQEDSWWDVNACLREGDRVIAWFWAGGPTEKSPSYAENGHQMWTGFSVAPEHRRNGIGSRFLREAVKHIDRVGARVLNFGADEDFGRAFLDHVGAEVKQVERYSRLAWAEVDWQQVDRWIADLESRAPGYSVEIFVPRIPEDRWPEYCADRTELTNLIPRDGLDMGDWTFTPEQMGDMYRFIDAEDGDHLAINVRDPEGKIIGMTDMAWTPHKPNDVYQYFTGVHPDARGKGIGKFVKARMLRLLAERYPDKGLRWLRTDNATSNAAMLAINERLGFQEFKRWDAYQIERKDLEAYT